VTVTEFIDGKKYSPTIPVINWDKPEMNSFIVTEELEVQRSGGVSTRRPDIRHRHAAVAGHRMGISTANP
jgi:type I restriction enzyme, R subunit